MLKYVRPLQLVYMFLVRDFPTSHAGGRVLSNLATHKAASRSTKYDRFLPLFTDADRYIHLPIHHLSLQFMTVLLLQRMRSRALFN